MWVREVGNYLSDVGLFKHSIGDLCETCVSWTLNQTQVMMAVPAGEDLRSERGVTALKERLWSQPDLVQAGQRVEPARKPEKLPLGVGSLQAVGSRSQGGSGGHR